MKDYIIKFKDNTIELSEKPEIYLFTDESCTKSEWMPFDMNKFREHQIWVKLKIYQDHDFNLHNHENIRFKLKNPDDINIFIKWMSEYAEVIFKKEYIKDIEYIEINNGISDETITFLSCTLVYLSDDYIEISADYILT